MIKTVFMIRVYRAIVVCSIAVFLFQCQKEISLQNGTGQVSSNPLLGTIQGNVMDENDQPATGVVVKVGTKSATTDTRGYFRITGASLDPNASLVTAEKAGYFKAYRTFKATSGANQVALKLTKKIMAGTISASTGGEVTLSNGSKVSLPANGIVQASDGAAYSGTVTVYAAYIDPASVEIDRTIPGSLMA